MSLCTEWTTSRCHRILVTLSVYLVALTKNLLFVCISFNYEAWREFPDSLSVCIILFYFLIWLANAVIKYSLHIQFGRKIQM